MNRSWGADLVEWLRARNPFRLGLVAALVVLVLILGTLGFGELGLGQRRYVAEFAQAGELRVGDDVRVFGISVGEVTARELEGDHVLVSFRVARKVRLGAATQASIKLVSLLGGRYLDLRPSGTDDLTDDRIPLAHTTVPYDLQKVLQTGTPFGEDLDPVAFRDSLHAFADTFRGTGPQIGAALDGMSRVSDVITSRRDQIAHLINSADAVTQLLDTRSARLFALLGQSDTLVKELVRRRDLLRGVLTDLAGFTGELRGALAEDQDKIGPLLHDTADLTDVLKQQDDAVDRALELIGPAVRYGNNAVGNGPYLEGYAPFVIIPDNFLCQAHAVAGCGR